MILTMNNNDGSDIQPSLMDALVIDVRWNGYNWIDQDMNVMPKNRWCNNSPTSKSDKPPINFLGPNRSSVPWIGSNVVALIVVYIIFWYSL